MTDLGQLFGQLQVVATADQLALGLQELLLEFTTAARRKDGEIMQGISVLGRGAVGIEEHRDRHAVGPDEVQGDLAHAAGEAHLRQDPGDKDETRRPRQAIGEGLTFPGPAGQFLKQRIGPQDDAIGVADDQTARGQVEQALDFERRRRHVVRPPGPGSGRDSDAGPGRPPAAR